MPGDGVVSIGATFDKTNVDAGLGDTQAMVKATMEAISSTVTEAGAKQKVAWKQLSDAVKESAGSISTEAIKVAEASRGVAAAQADVYRAITLTKSATIPAAETMKVLAAAQVKLTESQAAAAAAVKEQAAAIAAANEEAALSSNWVVAAFQRMSLEVRESLTLVQEKMIETAETSGLEAGGMSSAFAALSEVLLPAMAGAFIGHYIDDLAKVNVELDHLSTKTGISITALAGLQQIMKEEGGDFETVNTGLVRMESNIQKLSEGKTAPVELADAFTNLGLTLDEVRAAKPEQVLQMIATAMANTADQNIRANSAIAIFGRGGQALIPTLVEEGERLTDNMNKMGALTGITDESAEAARRWTLDVARLSSEFRSVMIPVMEHAEDAVMGMVGVWDIAAASMVTAFEVVPASVVAAAQAIAGLGKMMGDLTTGNISAVKNDFTEMKNSILHDFSDISNSWKQVGRDFVPPLETIQAKNFTPTVPTAAATGAPAEQGGGRGSRSAAFQADKQELDQQKIDHRVNLEEEIEFWKAKLAAAKKGTDEYKAIVATLAGLMQKEDRKPKQDTGGPETQAQNLGVRQPDSGLSELEAGSANAEFITSLQGQVEATQDATEKELQAYREQAEEKLRLAHEDFADTETRLANEVQLGQITERQRIAGVIAAARDEEKAREEQSTYIQMLDMGDTKKFAAGLKTQEKDYREYTRQIAKMMQELAMENQNAWKKGLQKMTSDFNSDVARWIVTGKSFEKSMVQLMASISENFIKNLLKMAEQEMMAALQHKSLMQQGVIADAHKAASGAYAATSDIPVVGPALAPVAAAAAFAATMAFDSFAAGGVVQGGGGMAVPILAHAGERVLSPAQTANFEKMVNQSSSSSVHQTNHLTQNLNGYDRAGMKAALRDHADDILDIVRSGYRSGALSA